MRVMIYLLTIAAGFSLVVCTPAPQETPPFPVVTAAPGTVALGKPCSTSDQCANGAGCYALIWFQIPLCGNYLASCTSDCQCAFNAPCIQGFCGGDGTPHSYSCLIASSSSETQPSVTTTSGSQPYSTALTSTTPIVSSPCAGTGAITSPTTKTTVAGGNNVTMTAQPSPSASEPLLSNDGAKNGNSGAFTLGGLVVAGLLFAWLL